MCLLPEIIGDHQTALTIKAYKDDFYLEEQKIDSW